MSKKVGTERRIRPTHLLLNDTEDAAVPEGLQEVAAAQSGCAVPETP